MQDASAQGGSEGNARLTALTGLALLVLLAAEGATIPFVRQLLTLHVFLGLLLIPTVLLKMAATGWRFFRYYTGRRDYVAKGPPRAFMRVLVAPLVIVSTVVLFGTGVLLAIERPHGGGVLALHKASFLVWFWAMSAHVLGHVLKVPGLARADLDRVLPGSGVRQFIVAGAIIVGLVVALAALPAAHSWAHWAALHHRLDG